jgi:hypothetical protein
MPQQACAPQLQQLHWQFPVAAAPGARGCALISLSDRVLVGLPTPNSVTVAAAAFADSTPAGAAAASACAVRVVDVAA